MRDAQAKAREASDQASRVAPPNTGAAGKAKPGKSVKLGATAASEFDLLRELHEDPDGLEDDEREAIGHLVEHHDPDTGRLHLPDDPDVADKMAAHVASMASSYSDQIDDRSGEGSHAEGRGHAKRAMTALEKLRDTLDAHAADLRAKATAGAATTKKQEHEAKAAMHRAEAGKLPDDDVRVKLHHAAADEHDRAARWHGSTHIKNWDRAAAMTGERANGLSAEVEATDARLKANATAAAEAKLKSATHPSTKVAAEHDAKAAEHKAAAAKAGRNSSEESQHLYAAHLHKQTAHLHREVAAGRMGEANAKAASLGANEASEIANRTSAPSMTHQEAQAKAREHEQKGEHFGTINGGYGAAMYHAKAAQAWAGAAKMLREGSLAPEHAAGYLDHAQQHSDRAAKEEAETPHRIRAREAAAVHEHTAKQHTKAANEATKTGERSAHLEAAKLHTQAARDAHGYSNSTFDPNEISNRKDYESSVVAALKQSEHANTLSGAKPAQAAAEPQKAPVAASFDVQKNTGRETVNGHRIGNFGVHDDAPLHGGLATVTHIPTGLRVASDLSPEDGLALAKHLHEKAGDAHGTAEFGTPLNKDHPDSKRVLDALQSATAKPKPADVAKAIRNSAADHRARQDAAVTYAERAETHRTKAREATDTRVREAHSKAAEAHDKAAVELRKFAGNWSATHDAGKAKQTAEDAEAQARRDATAKPPEPKPAAEAKPAKVEPVARAMEALRKILPHRDADPEDRYRARWHIPKKGHMHATSIENHPEMQRAKVSPRHIADAVKRLQMRGEVEQMNTSAAGGGYSVRRTGDGGVDPTVDRRRRDEEMDRLRSS
jgi:hypothetical protein